MPTQLSIFDLPPPPVTTAGAAPSTQEPLQPCGHKAGEDCLICTVCGECRESLDSSDVCAECRDTDPSDPLYIPPAMRARARELATNAAAIWRAARPAPILTTKTDSDRKAKRREESAKANTAADAMQAAINAGARTLAQIGAALPPGTDIRAGLRRLKARKRWDALAQRKDR